MVFGKGGRYPFTDMNAAALPVLSDKAQEKYP